MSFLLVTGVTDGVTESEGDWGFLPRKPTMDSGGKGARRGKSTVGLDISRTNRKVPIRSHLLQFPLSRSSSNHHSHPFPPMKCQDSDGLFPETHPLWVNSETSPRAKLLATGNHSKIHFFRPTARFHLFSPAKMERITGGMGDDFIDTLNTSATYFTKPYHPPEKPAPQLTIHSTLAIGCCYLSNLTS